MKYLSCCQVLHAALLYKCCTSSELHVQLKEFVCRLALQQEHVQVPRLLAVWSQVQPVCIDNIVHCHYWYIASLTAAAAPTAAPCEMLLDACLGA